MRVDHIAIRVKSLDKMQKWYENNVGAVLVYEDTYYRRMKMQNTTIALISEKQYPYNHVGVLAENYTDLPEQGIRMYHRDGTVGVYQFDPEGNAVEFIHYRGESSKLLQHDEHKQESVGRRILKKIQNWRFSLLG
jgi:catechol-2,3-dioxygenase